MADELVFFTHPQSRGRIVRWMLEEIGTPYRTEVIEYGGPMHSEAYRAVNPMGKVPAVRHRGRVVTEAAAICAYLADAFPDAGLAPSSGERDAYYRWLFFAAGPLETATTHRHLGFEPPADKAGMLGYGSYPRVVDTLERALRAAPFICGERFSAADVYVGSQVGWGMLMGTLEKRAAFDDYWARVSTREAHRRANAIDDALAASA